MLKIINNLYNATLNLFGKTSQERFYTITNLFFILTILIASFASLFHVRGFWLTTNEYFWATALAGATGLGIIGSMMASKYTWWTYISFGVIIIMELLGNVYDAFKFIDVASENFIAWKQLVEPIFEMIYVMPEGQSIPDIIYMRWIACIQGSFIPLLVAIVFHMWMKIRKSYKESTIDNKVPQEPNYEQVLTKEVSSAKTEEVILPIEPIEPIEKQISLEEQELTNEYLNDLAKSESLSKELLKEEVSKEEIIEKDSVEDSLNNLQNSDDDSKEEENKKKA